MKKRHFIRIVSLLGAIALLCYIIIVAVKFKDSRQDEPCKELIVTIKKETDKGFVSEAEVVAALKQASLHPAGKSMKEINTDKIELEIMRNGMIDNAEAYKTPSGAIKLNIVEKTPILRIMTGSENYYVDSKGSPMPVSRRYSAYVPIANGYVEKELAASDLYKFALFLHENEFWNSQIEQIYIQADGNVELIPRVGEHRIVLGSFENFKEKLDNLRLFYEQALPKTGWSKYSSINLKYKNQIVCTKHRGL